MTRSIIRPASRHGGFSLIEMAIVLVIVGTLLGGLLISLAETREITNRSDTEVTMGLIKEALYGFAQANGRLPCPATSTSDGAEAPLGGGTCTQQYGFVPSSTLGLSGTVNTDGLLTDKWLNPYRYSVSNANADAFTTTNGMRTATMAVLVPDLRVCTSSACGTVIVDSVPVVLLSLGADWDTFTSGNEVENSGEATIAGYRHGNDDDFVSSGYIQDTFDDIITWVSPNILYTRMISAGQLP